MQKVQYSVNVCVAHFVTKLIDKLVKGEYMKKLSHKCSLKYTAFLCKSSCGSDRALQNLAMLFKNTDVSDDSILLR